MKSGSPVFNGKLWREPGEEPLSLRLNQLAAGAVIDFQIGLIMAGLPPAS
jgi:hypothetical protein